MELTLLNHTWRSLFLIVYFAIAAYAAAVVYRDASKRRDLFLGLHPLWWAAVTVIGTIASVVGYWALHYSSLRQTNGEAARADVSPRHDETSPK